MGDLTTNFSVKEFTTDYGEFNLDVRYPLVLQAFRSWLGEIVNVSSGCRLPDDANDNSTHNIYIRGDDYDITIPATSSDISVDGMDTWELMDEFEDWVDGYDYTEPGSLVIESSDAVMWRRFSLMDIPFPLITGRGCYPDTHNQCVHLDMGHLSMNPAIRDKRKQITRWVRVKGVYHMAHDGELFADMRGRLGL